MLEHQVQTINYVRKEGNLEVSDSRINIVKQIKVQIVEVTPIIVLSQDFYDEAWNIWNKI